MDANRLAELEALAAKATPIGLFGGYPVTADDIIFCLAARTAVPELIAEVRKLRALLQGVLDSDYTDQEWDADEITEALK